MEGGGGGGGGGGRVTAPFAYSPEDILLRAYIRLTTRLSVRYGNIFHEPKASEISRHISQLTSVTSKCFILRKNPGSFS